MKWPLRVTVPLLSAAALLLSGVGSAADDPGVIRVEMLLGQDATISGGPIRELICDDGNLVKVEYVADGVALKGLRVGTTLCSFRDAASVRQVLRVVVREPPAAAPPAPSTTSGASSDEK
jgi:hypothetical protein